MRKVGWASSPFAFSQMHLLDQSSISFNIIVFNKKETNPQFKHSNIFFKDYRIQNDRIRGGVIAVRTLHTLYLSWFVASKLTFRKLLKRYVNFITDVVCINKRILFVCCLKNDDVFNNIFSKLIFFPWKFMILRKEYKAKFSIFQNAFTVYI